jgi:o-succinylbenzoate synthase
MLKADFQKYLLKFKSPAGTSRGVYTERASWFISVWDDNSPTQRGIGECAPLPGLSPELDGDFEAVIAQCCREIAGYHDWPRDRLYGHSSLRMALETAFLDLGTCGCTHILFPTDFTDGEMGIPINGLIWMGDRDFMAHQIREKLQAGFRCLKLKIGALDFSQETALITDIRRINTEEQIEIRLDANGAFEPSAARRALHDLAALGIHSIEQPIMAGQWQDMANLCRSSPIPIALDEELIGIEDVPSKERLLQEIRPAYLILKPTLHGGFSGCREWIALAQTAGIGWWVTSALESNVGLGAIAQWTATLGNPRPQGLGTGQLYVNNFPSPLYINRDQLRWQPGVSLNLLELHHE